MTLPDKASGISHGKRQEPRLINSRELLSVLSFASYHHSHLTAPTLYTKEQRARTEAWLYPQTQPSNLYLPSMGSAENRLSSISRDHTPAGPATQEFALTFGLSNTDASFAALLWNLLAGGPP